jgi:hypothetical protein
VLQVKPYSCAHIAGNVGSMADQRSEFATATTRAETEQE